MSKSLKRVNAAAIARELAIEVIEMTVPTKTAQQAADAVNVLVDQIAKSIIFHGTDSDQPILFLTAGGHRVDAELAASVAGEPLARADAAFIRATTGFAIGGVSPIGHLCDVATYFDPRLTEFSEIWAAAGTPRHMFKIAPEALIAASGAVLASFTV